MIIVLFLIGFLTLMMAIGMACADKSPVGYEDETGFHFGALDAASATPLSLFPKEISSQPGDEKLIPLFPLRTHWLHKVVGIAAIFIGLLVLLPEKLQNVEKPLESSMSMDSAKLEESEFIFENVEAPTLAVTVRSEPSRLIQGLCLRFSEVE
jgi:hypothetical protein